MDNGVEGMPALVEDVTVKEGIVPEREADVENMRRKIAAESVCPLARQVLSKMGVEDIEGMERVQVDLPAGAKVLLIELPGNGLIADEMVELTELRREILARIYSFTQALEQEEEREGDWWLEVLAYKEGRVTCVVNPRDEAGLVWINTLIRLLDGVAEAKSKEMGWERQRVWGVMTAGDQPCLEFDARGLKVPGPGIAEASAVIGARSKVEEALTRAKMERGNQKEDGLEEGVDVEFENKGLRVRIAPYFLAGGYEEELVFMLVGEEGGGVGLEIVKEEDRRVRLDQSDMSDKTYDVNRVMAYPGGEFWTPRELEKLLENKGVTELVDGERVVMEEYSPDRIAEVVVDMRHYSESASEAALVEGGVAELMGEIDLVLGELAWHFRLLGFGVREATSDSVQVVVTGANAAEVKLKLELLETMVEAVYRQELGNLDLGGDGGQHPWKWLKEDLPKVERMELETNPKTGMVEVVITRARGETYVDVGNPF